MGCQDQFSLNAGQKYCRMQGEHSAIRLTFINLPFPIKIFVLSIFELPFYTGFTVFEHNLPAENRFPILSLDTVWQTEHFHRDTSHFLHTFLT